MPRGNLNANFARVRIPACQGFQPRRGAAGKLSSHSRFALWCFPVPWKPSLRGMSRPRAPPSTRGRPRQYLPIPAILRRTIRPRSMRLAPGFPASSSPFSQPPGCSPKNGPRQASFHPPSAIYLLRFISLRKCHSALLQPGKQFELALLIAPDSISGTIPFISLPAS